MKIKRKKMSGKYGDLRKPKKFPQDIYNSIFRDIRSFGVGLFKGRGPNLPMQDVHLRVAKAI
jgi:hypothetical protein